MQEQATAVKDEVEDEDRQIRGSTQGSGNKREGGDES